MTPERFYKDKLDEKSEVKRLGWNSPKDQQINFAVGIEIIESKFALAGTSVHDAGCGHGDLLPHLRKRGIEKYVGTDFMEEPLVIAREAHKDANGGTEKVRFERLELRTDKLPQVDVTFVFGALAFHTGKDGERMLKRLYDASKLALVFHSWWDIDKSYVNYTESTQMQKRIERFLQDKSHVARIRNYGVAREAMFGVFKKH